jgi:osmotically-inducible protein OsmY
MADPAKPLGPDRPGQPGEYRPTEADVDLTGRLRAALAPLDILGLRAEVRRGVAHLRGVVRSNRLRDEVESTARDVPGITGLVSGIAVETAWPGDSMAPEDLEPLLGAEDEFSGITTVPGTEPDLNQTNWTNDPAAAADGNEPYYAPTDPIVRPIPRDDGDLEIVGGFASGSLDSPIEEVNVLPQFRRGDEEIAAEVARALQEDAETSDLNVEVRVRRGVVILRGQVNSLDEAEAAEQVAANVPDVREVREEFDVAGM